MRRLALLVIALGLSLPANARAEKRAKSYERSVVPLVMVRQANDLESPWKRLEQQIFRSLGVVIPGQRVLTSAWSVAHSAYIEMRPFGASSKAEMRVAFVDWEANLAILRPVDPSSMNALIPMEIGGPEKVGEPLEIFREQDSSQLRRIPTRLTQVDVLASQTGGLPVLTYRMEAKEEGLGFSEPVIARGRLAGLVIGQDERTLYGLPAPVINHFLRDRHDDSYRGFPILWIQTRELMDHVYRRLLKADSVKGGVRVSRVFENSPFRGLVEVDDVLLKVGPCELSDAGAYEDPLFGRVPLSVYLNQLYSGDKVSLTLLRHGRRVVVTAPVTRFDANRSVIRRHNFSREEPYLIVGGLLFVELTRPYLESWGDSWRYRAPMALVYRSDFEDLPRENPKERIVVLSRVLADDFNHGYSSLQPQVLLEANGQRVTSIEALENILAEHPLRREGRAWMRLSFDLGSGEVILPVDRLDAVHARIAKTYGIPASASFLDPLANLPGPVGKRKSR